VVRKINVFVAVVTTTNKTFNTAKLICAIKFVVVFFAVPKKGLDRCLTPHHHDKNVVLREKVGFAIIPT